MALDGALTREEVAERLGISPPAVSGRLRDRRLVALQPDRIWMFPAWQFDEDGSLRGLADLIATYPGTALALSIWATTPNPDLDGQQPADLLRSPKGTDRVLRAVLALTPAAW